MENPPKSKSTKTSLSFETVGSIVAIIVGIAALIVSWDQSRLMREEIRASVWPALQVDGVVDSSKQQLTIGLRVQNAGVGPALIERINVYHQGTLIKDIEALAEHMPPGANRSQHTLTGRIIAAGASTSPFTFRYQQDEAVDAIDVLNSLANDWSVEICYCSSLKQCWISDFSTTPPREIEHCKSAAASDL